MRRGARLLQRLPSVLARNVEKRFLVQPISSSSSSIGSSAIVSDRIRGCGRARQQFRCLSGQASQNNESAEGEEPAVDPRWGVLLLRGLPYTVHQDRVKALFQAYELVPDKAVWFEKNAMGCRTGCAYVAFANEDAAKAAARAQDMSKIGDRYIEMFPSDPKALLKHLRNEVAPDREPVAWSKPGSDNKDHGDGRGQEVRWVDPSWGVVKLKGLPYTASENDVKAFMDGFDMVDGDGGVWVERDDVGRPTGCAYVAMRSAHAARAALSLDMRRMGSRYIEVFSGHSDSLYDYLRVEDTRDPPGDLSHLKHVVQVHGLPYGCTNRGEIRGFFKGVDILRNGVYFGRRVNGKPSTDAFVVLTSNAELRKALGYDKAMLKERYLDVWPVSGFALLSHVGPGVLLSHLPDASRRIALMVRGLGPKASVEDVRRLLDGFEIEPYGVFVITAPDGHVRGEAYVVMSSEAEAERACGSLNRKKKSIQNRWIELLQVSKGDVYTATVSSPIVGSYAGCPLYANRPMTCVRLRFLPPDVKEDNLFAFFHGLNIDSVMVSRDEAGQCTGEAVVQFGSLSDCQRAMARNRDCLQPGNAKPVEVRAVSKGHMQQLVTEWQMPGVIETGKAARLTTPISE